MDSVMQTINKAVTFIWDGGLKLGRFQYFLKNIDADFGDIVHFSDARWLNRGKMLNRFYEVKRKMLDRQWNLAYGFVIFNWLNYSFKLVTVLITILLYYQQ